MAKPRGLGKGLSALIPERVPEEPIKDSEQNYVAMELDAIEMNPFQPRKAFDDDELKSLAESIAVHGVIQPVLVRRIDRRVQLVAGERRVRAARMAGMSTIPAYVRDLSDRDMMEIALVENLQRSELNPIEEAKAFQRLISDFAWTQEQIGVRVGRSRSHVANYLRVLQLEDDVQEAIARQDLSVAHAKLLLSADESGRRELAHRAIQEQWTVKQLAEALDRESRAGADKSRQDDIHLRTVEVRLRRRFGTKVSLRGDAHKGKIEISYRSLGEFERILEILQEEKKESSGGFVV